MHGRMPPVPDGTPIDNLSRFVRVQGLYVTSEALRQALNEFDRLHAHLHDLTDQPDDVLGVVRAVGVGGYAAALVGLDAVLVPLVPRLPPSSLHTNRALWIGAEG